MEKKRQEVRILTLKTSLNPPPFIEVSVHSRENERLCISVYGVSISALSSFLIFDFGIVPTVWYYFLFHFILNKYTTPSEQF